MEAITNEGFLGLPPFINLRPTVLDSIPWGWENTFYGGLPQVSKPRGEIVMPELWKYFHWNMFDYDNTECCEDDIFGTRDQKSIFTTAARFLGYERLFIEQPDLRPITEAFLFWHELLFKATPEKLTYFVLGDDMAGNLGPFMSPELFTSWVLPEWKILADFAHAHDCKLIIHSDGDIAKLIPAMLTLDPWGLNYQPIGRMSDVKLWLKTIALYPIPQAS